MPVSIIPAGDAPLRGPALTYLYHRLPHGERERQLMQTLAAVSRQELSLENLLVAVDDDRIVGAVLAIAGPAVAAFLWPPIIEQGDSAQSVGRDLLEAVGRRGRPAADRVYPVSVCSIRPTSAVRLHAGGSGGVPRITDLHSAVAAIAGKHALMPANRG